MPPRTKDQLVLKIANARGRPIPLGDTPITIGRHPDNRLRLKDEKSSRHHCVIEPDDTGSFRVRDLGSRNGTKLNGNKITAARLNEGDQLQVGSAIFQVQAKANAATPVTSSSKKGDAPWVSALKEVMDAFPPSGPNDEHVVLVAADGKTSDTLGGVADGPLAARLLLRIASRTRATDLHHEPKGEQTTIRMRIDGQMVWIADLPNKIGELFAGVVRSACQLGAEGRVAVQDGRFSLRFSDRTTSYRVSFTPSVHGQKLVIRVLDQRGVPTAIEDLGLAGYMSKRILEVCQQDAGLLLVCGPTGSGKTTTLYNALREIDRESRNVITIEDPVEYELDGVTQIPIDIKRGNDFNTLLRSVLRQDPDVILLGEIRDEETARTAMQAAMTGHLVFSTVHAKDTITSVFRLLDLRVEPYLVANSLNLVLAQRLVRTLCPACKRDVPVTPSQATEMGRYLGGKTKLYAATGCIKCLKTGYRGRSALFELLDVTDELRDIILSNPNIQAMRKVVDHGLFTTLKQSGYKLAAEGTTSMEEVGRVAVT